MKLRVLFLIFVLSPLSVYSVPNTEGEWTDISEYRFLPEGSWTIPLGSDQMNILMLSDYNRFFQTVPSDWDGALVSELESEEGITDSSGEGYQVSDPVSAGGNTDSSTGLQEYYAFIIRHQKWVLWTQYIFSVIIFIFIISMSILGLVFSVRRFKDARTRENTEIEIFNMKLKTSTVGFVILFFSVLFFYLYVIIVYPVSFV